MRKMKVRKEHGQGLVEFALVLPMFLLLIIGIAYTSILGFQYLSIHSAAADAAEVLSRNPATPDSVIVEDVIKARMENIPGLSQLVDNMEVTIEPDEAARYTGTGDSARVTMDLSETIIVTVKTTVDLGVNFGPLDLTSVPLGARVATHIY